MFIYSAKVKYPRIKRVLEITDKLHTIILTKEKEKGRKQNEYPSETAYAYSMHVAWIQTCDLEHQYTHLFRSTGTSVRPVSWLV
jgi:hypothetical protein